MLNSLASYINKNAPYAIKAYKVNDFMTEGITMSTALYAKNIYAMSKVMPTVLRLMRICLYFISIPFEDTTFMFAKFINIFFPHIYDFVGSKTINHFFRFFSAFLCE